MKQINWAEKCYRFSHTVHRLHPGMVNNSYAKQIDGLLVNFDRDYVVERVLMLLSPLRSLGAEIVVDILLDSIRRIRTEWLEDTQLKDD